MMKLIVPLLAVVTVIAVAFILVELRAPLTPSPTTPTTPPAPRFAPPPNTTQPAPPAAPAATAQRPITRTSTQSPQGPRPYPEPPPDRLDVVVNGKTRREWHAYYAERQQQYVAEMQRYQSVVDRAINGEEPDPRELAEAHDHIRELGAKLKEDLQALQAIDHNP